MYFSSNDIFSSLLTSENTLPLCLCFLCIAYSVTNKKAASYRKFMVLIYIPPGESKLWRQKYSLCLHVVKKAVILSLLTGC